MASERPLDTYLARGERPETSKFSRNSRRSEFQSTMTDFNVNPENQNKNQSRGDKKGETQTKFYSSKTKFYKTNSFNSTFYPTDKNNAQKRLDDSKEHSEAAEYLPEIKEVNSPDTKAFGLEMVSNNGDLKPGLTLDKVLGGSFKKIDLFDTNLKEFERQGSYTDDIIEEKTNEISDTDAKEYQYESFEILETDDEDEASEIQKDEPTKDGARANQQRGSNEYPENHEILSKIQNKYKSSKPKFLPKNKLKGFRVRSPLKENRPDTDFNVNANQEREKESRGEGTKRKRDLTPTRSESESPKFGSSLNTNKAPPMRFNNSKGFSEIPHLMSNETEQRNLDSPCDSQNGLRRTSNNPFSTTKENFRTTSEKFRTTMMKKTFYQKNSIPTNPTSGVYEEEQEQDYELEKVGGRSHSLAGPLKPTENMAKFYEGKGFGNGLEQKFLRENKMMTDKIKQSEKEMMDKYAKMFKLNQHEMLNLCKDSEKKQIGPKRLSTPLKDFNCTRNFQKRKIINL